VKNLNLIFHHDHTLFIILSKKGGIYLDLFADYKVSSEVGISVIKRKNEGLSDLIRRFKKKYSKSGLNKEVRDLLAYDKPSVKKRKKSAAAKRTKLREEQKNLNQTKKKGKFKNA